MPVYPKENQLSSIIWPELSPSPGRFAGSLRDMIGVVLAVVLCMTLRVPGIALALALLFLLQREHPGVTLRSGIQIVSSAAAACAATFLWVQFTDGTDLARFLGFIIVIFTAAFGTAATRFPLFWSIFGFYGSLDVAAWDAHRTSNAIVTSSLYNLASLSLVVLCAVVVDYAFATHNPDEVLQQEMRRRLVSLASFFRKLADAESTSRNEALRTVHHELIRYANAGDVYLNELYDQIHDEDQKLARVPLGIHYRIGLLTRVLDKSALLGFSTSTGSARQDHRDAYQMIAALCDSLLTLDATTPTQTTTTPMSSSLWGIFLELQQYREVQLPIHGASIRRSSGQRNPPANSVFLPGVFESPDVTLHALKLTFAATICYIIYNAVAWPLHRTELNRSNEAEATVSHSWGGDRWSTRDCDCKFVVPEYGLHHRSNADCGSRCTAFRMGTAFPQNQLCRGANRICIFPYRTPGIQRDDLTRPCPRSHRGNCLRNPRDVVHL